MLYEIVSTEHIMHQLPSDTYWKMLLLLEGGGGGIQPRSVWGQPQSPGKLCVFEDS